MPAQTAQEFQRLRPRTRLGPYEIVSFIGRGGMGEVYRGHDQRLDRDVAIKVIAAQGGTFPALRDRFEREAKVIARLNHPRICAIYDVGVSESIDFIVMELVEGETLVDRLARGPLLLEDVLRYGAQIADALEKAHRQGIVHRDLKPSNIMMTESGAKLLDFGLARLTSTSLSATVTRDPFAADRPVSGHYSASGTIQYASPELLEGKEADSRSDLFSFGLVLYEMLTGRYAFIADNEADLTRAILSARPQRISEFRADVPSTLEHLVENCLVKDRDKRWQTAHDVFLEIATISTQLADVQRTQAPSRFGVVSFLAKSAAVTAGLVLSVLVAILYRANAPHAVGAQRYTMFAPRRPGAVHTPGGLAFISPDGRYVAWVASNGFGTTSLAVQNLATSEVTFFPETAGDVHFPFWSPDSREIAFFGRSHLKKVRRVGGPIETVAEASRGQGGAWNRDGTILFTPDYGQPVYRVSASGGTPVQVSLLDRSAGETGHQWPCFLPGGRRFVYLALSANASHGALWVGDLSTSHSYRLWASDTGAVYSPPGYLIFRYASTLYATPISVDGSGIGDPRPIQTPVFATDRLGPPYISASAEGTLLYHTSELPQAEIAWIDRRGRWIETVGSKDVYRDPALSPDGSLVAVTRVDQERKIWHLWLADTRRRTLSPLSDKLQRSTSAVWSPDSHALAVASNTGDVNHLFKVDVRGGEAQTLVRSSTSLQPTDWTGDGRFVLYETTGQVTRRDIWMVSAGGGQAPAPLLHSPSNEEGATVSPDGHFLAYTSDESGRYEVYVATFPPGSERQQVSFDGAVQPGWRADGRELFFLSLEGAMMSALVSNEGGGLTLKTPRKLFGPLRSELINFGSRNTYVPARNGQRFLFTLPTTDVPNPLLVTNVIRNWPALLSR